MPGLSRNDSIAPADPAAAGQMDTDCWRETGVFRREVEQPFWPRLAARLAGVPSPGGEGQGEGEPRNQLNRSVQDRATGGTGQLDDPMEG